jgi:hypothetical protein
MAAPERDLRIAVHVELSVDWSEWQKSNSYQAENELLRATGGKMCAVMGFT